MTSTDSQASGLSKETHTLMIMQDIVPHGCDHQRIPWPYNEWNTVPLPFPTSLIHLLHHNHPPSVLEASRAKKFKKSVQQSLMQQTQDEIQRLQNELNRLKSVQITLQKQVFACDVILSPFRRLPLDVIHTIITHCATLYPPSASSNTTSNPRSHLPSILAQTSKIWRHAVCGTSRLWQDLHFSFEDWGTGADYIMARAALFTRLARSLPLSIHINRRHRTFPDEAYNWTHCHVSFLQWILAIWQDRDRMTRLCLTGVSPAVVVQQWQVGVDRSLHYPAPAVKAILFLEEDKVYGDGLESGTVSKLLDLLPQLQHIWLGCRVSLLRAVAHLSDTSLQSWSRLKTLYMGTSFSALDWRGLLRVCPNLEAAFLHIHHESAQHAQTPSHTIIHQHLKELILRFTVYKRSILAPFCGLEFPNVHTLELTFVHSKLRSALPHNLKKWQLLSSTFPSLKSLCIHKTSHIETSIDRIFPLFLAFGSTVTSLRISLSFRHACKALSFLCGWTSKSKSRPLPRLETLLLDFCLEPASWNDKLPAQLTPLFINVRRSLGTRTSVPLLLVGPHMESSSNSPPVPNLQSMTVCLNMPPRPNETRTNRKTIRFFVGLQKKYEAERVGIRVKIETSSDDSFEPYERRFMERFQV